MPIIHMLTNEPEDTRSAISWLGNFKTHARIPWPDGSYCSLAQRDIVLYETHHGLCLSSRERNGYDDSDFIMTVWDPVNQKPFEMEYATTRCWTYLCMASYVDATDEVREAYSQWCAKVKAAADRREKYDRVMRKLEARQLERKVAKKLGVPLTRFIRLRKSPQASRCPNLYRLILSKRVSSKFKLSVRGQAEAWFKSENPPYGSPLSPRQWSYI